VYHFAFAHGDIVNPLYGRRRSYPDVRQPFRQDFDKSKLSHKVWNGAAGLLHLKVPGRFSAGCDERSDYIAAAHSGVARHWSTRGRWCPGTILTFLEPIYKGGLDGLPRKQRHRQRLHQPMI